MPGAIGCGLSTGRSANPGWAAMVGGGQNSFSGAGVYTLPGDGSGGLSEPLRLAEVLAARRMM